MPGSDTAASSQPAHSTIGNLADKLQSGIGLATEEMPLAGDLLALIARMFEAFHHHVGSGQQ